MSRKEYWIPWSWSGYELVDMGDGIRTWVLYKNSTWS